MTKDTADLVETLQMLRAERFPDLAESLVSQIIHVESETFDDRTEAEKQIGRLVEAYLAKGDI